MNTRNRITLLLAAIIVVALLVVGMTLTTSAANEGDLVTEYGVVPAANANDNFAIFHKAEGASEYTFFASASNPFTYNNAAYQSLTGEVVMLMLKDTDFSAQNTVNLTPAIKSDLTVDLGGHTLIGSTKGTGTFNIYGIALSQDTVMNYTIKNGTIKNKNNEVVLVGHTEAELGHNLVTNLTLDHITFTKFENTASYEQNVVQVNTKPVSPSVMNILYNECVLDLTNISTSGNTGSAICSDRATGKQVINTEFRGGEIRVASMTGFTLINGKNVKFTKGENGYFKFVAPKTETVSYNITSMLENETSVFVKTFEDATHAYYQAIDRQTEYGLIPSGASASVWDYPFIIFTRATGSEEWTFLRACNDSDNDPWVDGNITRWWQFNGDVVIYMRRDVDFTNRVTCTNCIRPNVNLIIDMNGHTMIASEASNGTFFFATKATTNYGGGNGNDHRYWTFKNGTIQTKSSCFILFGHNTKIEDNPTVNLTFDNITFDRADGATKEQPFVQCNSVTDSAFTANVTYNDCTFDIRGELPSPKLYLFTVCNNVNSLLTTNVVVNGGKILADDTDTLQLYLLGSKNLGSFAMNEGSNGELLQLVLPVGTVNQFIKGGDNTADLVNIPGAPYAYSYWKTSSDGVNDTYSLVPYWMTTSQAIPKTSVTLSTDLIYNIYLPTGRVTAAKINGEVVNLKNVPQVTLDNGLTYWHITVNAGLLGAGDEIELVTTINVGGSARVDATRKINVVKYAKTVLASNLGETNNKLAKDLLAYVKAACVYAGNKAETVAAIEAIIGADYTVNPEVAEAVASTAGLKSAALLLGDKPAFVFFPELDENGDAKYDLNAYKFAIGDTTVTTEITEIDGKTAIVVYTYAYAMSETVTYTIEGTEISGAYNLASYLAYEKAAGNTKTVALVEALYAYSLAAKTYKTENA